MHIIQKQQRPPQDQAQEAQQVVYVQTQQHPLTALSVQQQLYLQPPAQVLLRAQQQQQKQQQKQQPQQVCLLLLVKACYS